MNKYIKILMEDLNLEVHEKFEIVKGAHNPYFFGSDGLLYDADYDIRVDMISDLVYGICEVKKIMDKQTLNILESAKSKGYYYIIYLKDVSKYLLINKQNNKQATINIDKKYSYLNPGCCFVIDKLLEEYYTKNKKGENK